MTQFGFAFTVFITGAVLVFIAMLSDIRHNNMGNVPGCKRCAVLFTGLAICGVALGGGAIAWVLENVTIGIR